jgi:hypothetical protein
MRFAFGGKKHLAFSLDTDQQRAYPAIGHSKSLFPWFMKKLVASLGILLFFHFNVFADESQVRHALNSSNAVVWAGLDYSMMRVVGNTNDIPVPDLFSQGMPEKWNDLFLDERIEGVANSLKKHISLDISGVTERNKAIDASQNFVNSDDTDCIEKSNVAAKDISDAVRSYKMQHTSGVGLVFIIDRFVYQKTHVQPTYNSPKADRQSYVGAVYVVFFDIATREIISAKREVHYVGNGGSFRNFWFGPIKDTDSTLGRYAN